MGGPQGWMILKEERRVLVKQERVVLEEGLWR
jgi:hypothetical protein